MAAPVRSFAVSTAAGIIFIYKYKRKKFLHKTELPEIGQKAAATTTAAK